MNDFRKIKGSDYSTGIIELLSQLSPCDKNHMSKKDFENWVSSQLNAFHSIYVLERNNKIVATGTIIIEPKLIHNFGLVAHIEDIVVDSGTRNSGLGKLLIQFLTNIAKNRGCYKVILDCSNKNIEFYQKCKYNEHGVEMSYYFKE
jgi:glucosamine-phosphate N-acetyltransferase